MSYRGGKKSSNYGGQRHSSSRRGGSKPARDYASEYVTGKITEGTWRRHQNADRRANAPNFEVILAEVKQRASVQGGADVGSYQGWTNWDTWETMLLLENSKPSSNWLDSWAKNWAIKIQQGKFSPELAEKVVKEYFVPVARGSKKPLFYDQYHEFTPDPNIDAKKVNAAEVVHNILSTYLENNS